jgi:hypothetical protein
LSAQMKTAVTNTVNGSYNTTDVFVNLGIVTCVSVTDVCFTMNNGVPPSSTTFGLTGCVARTTWSTKRCERYNVQFFSMSMGTFGELGHTFGLLHGADANPVMPNQSNTLSCMKGFQLDSSFPDIGLGVHNATHLNNSTYYP